jgi:3-methyladenine DNA glycosylase/8-oxoguanine DNA glycosylase
VPDAQRTVEIEPPYDLVRTLRRYAVWGTDPCIRFGANEVWNAFRATTGPATVRYEDRDRVIHVDAWGPGAEEAITLAPDHLGAHDRSHAYESDHPIVGPLLSELRPLRFGRTRRVMERLVPIVIAQKVTSAGASESWRELVYRYGERAPGPPEKKLWIGPSAETLRSLAYYDLHPMNLEKKRADTILFCARRSKRLESFVDLPDAYERLLAFPGIGPWTAALIVSGAMGSPDAVPTGDYHMPHHVAHALLGERRGTDEQMLELLEPFRPYRGRALSAILHGAPGVPRRGPRLSFVDIRAR